jgi:drug/metabolite transporter (DMT)-like permease
MLGTIAKMPWSNICFVQAWAQMIMSIPAMAITGQLVRFDLTGYQLFLIVLAGVIGSFSQVLMTIGMQREKSSVATAMRSSDVVFSFITA